MANGTCLVDARVAERFWAKVDKTPLCWLWTACLSTAGYGKFGLNGKSVYAHRLVWEWAHGPIPAGLEIDHLCRDRACLRLSHLELVTHAENIRRGTGLTLACQARSSRTHCPKGHERTTENTYVNPNTGRCSCRVCDRMRPRRDRVGAA